MVKKNSVFGQKWSVFSDKDFLDWPRPPPLLTESKKIVFFMPPCSITCIYYVDFVASVTRSACVKTTRKNDPFSYWSKICHKFHVCVFLPFCH